MSMPSPEPSSAQSVTAAGSVSPPSYTPRPLATSTPDPEDKIALQPVPPADEKIPAAETPKSERPPVAYEDAPEVVPEGFVPDDERPKYLADVEQNTNTTTTAPPTSQGGHFCTTTLQHQSPPPPGINQPEGYTLPQSMAVPPPASTVTPLHLLGEQSDAIDCPFCQRRAETDVKRHPSAWTHVGAVLLFFVTFCGAAAPYMCNWCTHVGHYCQNCGRRVAYRENGAKEMKALGTPEHLRQVSKYPNAPPPPQPEPSAY